MSHDHIGITRLVESGFANHGKVYVYDTIRQKSYWSSIDRLGTENNYYDKDVEKWLLSENIEKQFGQFYKDFCVTLDLKKMVRILSNNKELVSQYYSFMLFRSKRFLDFVNGQDLTKQTFGSLDHSEFLRFLFADGYKALTANEEEYFLSPVVNLSETTFINNSVGFCLLKKVNERQPIFIPLNTRVGILADHATSTKEKTVFLIEPGGDHRADVFNKSICNTEKGFGNGFIFGKDTEILKRYVEYMQEDE